MNSSNIHIPDERPAVSYFDPHPTALPTEISPFQAWNLIMADPLPFLKTAFCIRDAISSRFAGKCIRGFTGAKRRTVHVGEKLD